VLVRLPGTDKFVPLEELKEIPVGTEFDTRNGAVELKTANADGTINDGIFYGGRFIFTQGSATGAPTVLRLSGTELAACTTAGLSRTDAKRKPRRRLWGDGKGRFRTRGRYASATVRGTKWLVEDRCNGTLTKVARGVVAVRDFVLKKTVIVKAGHSYFANAHPKKKPRRKR
jgi:hypothetical protein